MSDINLTYTSPQDKLLIMLLERISTLEDVINKQSATLSNLVSISTSDVFTVIISAKYVNGRYEDLTTMQDVIKTLIHDIFPCHNIYATQYTGVPATVTVLLHTRDTHTLRDIETMLSEKMGKVGYAHTWLMKSPMKVLKNTEFFKNFRTVIL